MPWINQVRSFYGWLLSCFTLRQNKTSKQCGLFKTFHEDFGMRSWTIPLEIVFNCQNLRCVTKANMFLFHIVLESYTPELRVTCRFWTGRSKLLDLCALTSFIADGVRAFTSGCTVPGTDIARFALCWCTIWTLIARTCGARTSASCMRKKSYAEQRCCECIFLPSHRIAVNWVPNVLPLSILTATVLQVESLSIPKAEASTTLPKAPCPRVLPDRGKQYLVNGTAAELPVLQLHSQTVSYVLAAALKQHAQVLIIIIIIRLCSLRECVFDCSWDDGTDSKLFNERLTFIFT